ncbi:hypothetical protein [Acanthopleuribacter pedis]|uniref:Uncharacterized protein n=1 Tax=Acanthopleuribacter pedis TaxID=442870 RepID=A0A8J7Q699_9BACT|nr:hypothetical protein [Acanthopleuribacter pedis]MBO1318897.1 hypothetical protein [Acanthopleuribacter pedis]
MRIDFHIHHGFEGVNPALQRIHRDLIEPFATMLDRWQLLDRFFISDETVPEPHSRLTLEVRGSHQSTLANDLLALFRQQADADGLVQPNHITCRD